MKTEDYEKDFSGLEFWMPASLETAKRYKALADGLKLRMEYKTVRADMAELWVPENLDLEEFLKLTGDF
jgi:hypothetical protein